MLPDYSKTLTCPHCQGKKEVLSLASGNTFNGQMWSDTKTVYPMLPKVSFVQKCPHCGGYYLLSRQKEDDYADDFNGGTGKLSYPELKEAWAVFSEDATLTDDEKKDKNGARHKGRQSPQDQHHGEGKQGILLHKGGRQTNS